MRHIVYLTLNKVNKKIYVGVHSTEDPNVFDGYIGCGVVVTMPSSYKKSKTPFQYAVNKYGVNNFVRTTIKEFETKEEALKFESIIVNEKFIKRKDTYNAVIGGGIMPKQDKVIYQYTINGEFVRKWDSIIEASREYKCSHTAIMNAVTFKGSSNGFLWTDFFCNKINVEDFTITNSRRDVYQYDFNGILVKCHKSIIDAANDLKVLQSSIGRAIRGGYKVKGFNFSFDKYDGYEVDRNIKLKGRQIHMYNCDGKYIMTFENQNDVAKYFELKSTSKIASSIRLNRPFNGFQFSLEKFIEIAPVPIGITKPKRIAQYSLDGELIKEYDTISSAIQIFGTGIQKVLKGQRESCKGFVFKYL